MKKLFVLLLLVFTTICYSQTTTKKYNDLRNRWEYYNSSGQMVGYEKYNSLMQQWEYTDLSQNVSSRVHDYGDPISTFDADLAIMALAAKQRRYNEQVRNNKNRNERKKLEKINNLVDEAIIDQKRGNYRNAAAKLYKSYELEKQNTIYLYYAANAAVAAKDYQTALEYYNELVELDFNGTEIQSKKGEVTKNIVLIYIQQNKLDLAQEAMEKAKAENPNDIGLLQTEANMYYNLGKVDKYNQLMKEIVKKNPGNATSYYNLAVTSAELGDTESAIEYYKKAIELDPEMESAYFNLAATILQKEKGILEEMNKALSDGNNSKYDELGSQRKDLYKQALPYLEKSLTINPKNEDVMRTLMNIYYVLGKKTKADEIKAKL